LFSVDAFLGKVTIDEAAISTHYQSNQARYQTTETVDLEYVELTLADIASSIDVSDDALRKAYDEDRDRFQTTEERHARHILIAIDRATRRPARAKADGGRRTAAQAVRTSRRSRPKCPPMPARRPRAATSLDDASVRRPFEDALFAMQVGAISDPVRSEFRLST
jgi:peptidyl-prolyl cis-trans isomerase D